MKGMNKTPTLYTVPTNIEVASFIRGVTAEEQDKIIVLQSPINRRAQVEKVFDAMTEAGAQKTAVFVHVLGNPAQENPRTWQYIQMLAQKLPTGLHPRVVQGQQKNLFFETPSLFVFSTFFPHRASALVKRLGHRGFGCDHD